jgi:hypothetical protein
MKKSILLLLVISLLLYLACEMPTKPGVGALAVLSIPDSARIILNVSTGLYTPDTLENLEAGDYHLSLVKDHYSSWDSTVTVRKNEITRVVAKLKSVYGWALIQSDPEGAKIFLDDEDTGKVTPDTLRGWGNSYHRLTLKCEGYDDWRDDFSFVADSLIIIRANLAQKTGNLIVDSTPPYASIWLNGKETGFFTHHIFSDLPVGLYEIRLVKEDYKEWTGTATVEESKSTFVHTYLEPLPSQIIFDSNPQGAQVFLNGTYFGITPCTYENAPPGYYKIRLAKSSYFPWDALLNLEIARTERISADLTIAPPYKIAYHHQGSIWQVGLDGINPQELTPDAGSSLSSSPNGLYLISVAQDKMRLYRYDGSLVKEFPYGHNTWSGDIRWSNSSRYLTFSIKYDGSYLYDIETDVFSECIPSGYTYDHDLCFRPDDSMMAFAHHEYENNMYLFVSSACGRWRRITPVVKTGYDEGPYLQWYSNSGLIFKSSWSGVYIVEPQDTVVTPTLIIHHDVSYLIVSPNRSKVVFRYNGINYMLTGVWTPIWVSNPYNFLALAWSPSSDAIAVRTGDGLHWTYLDGKDYHILDLPMQAGGISVKH